VTVADAPYSIADTRGFAIDFTDRHGEISTHWFTSIEEAKSFKAPGLSVVPDSVRPQSCVLENGTFVWTPRPEWAARIREALGMS
jgi:hypothetical protein